MDAASVLDAYAAAWARGEPESAFEYYSDDVVMHLPGQGSLAGTHRGREAVVGTIKALLARTEGLTVEVEPLDRLTSDDRVALLVREVVSRGSEQLEIRRVNLYRVRDDHITDIEIFEADQYAVDAFFD